MLKILFVGEMLSSEITFLSRYLGMTEELIINNEHIHMSCMRTDKHIYYDICLNKDKYNRVDVHRDLCSFYQDADCVVLSLDMRLGNDELFEQFVLLSYDFFNLNKDRKVPLIFVGKNMDVSMDFERKKAELERLLEKFSDRDVTEKVFILKTDLDNSADIFDQVLIWAKCHKGEKLLPPEVRDFKLAGMELTETHPVQEAVNAFYAEPDEYTLIAFNEAVEKTRADSSILSSVVSWCTRLGTPPRPKKEGAAVVPSPSSVVSLNNLDDSFRLP